MWRTYPDPTWLGDTHAVPRVRGGLVLRALARRRGRHLDRGYDRSRTFFRAEDDFPGPQIMRVAADWLRRRERRTTTAGCCSSTSSTRTSRSTRPQPWLGRYDDEPWDDELLIWPPYADGAIVEGAAHRARGSSHPGQLRRKLSMIDHWFGQVLDALDAAGPVGLHRASSSAPTTATTSVRSAADATCGASPACRSSSRSDTRRCSCTGRARPGGDTIDALTTNVDLLRHDRPTCSRCSLRTAPTACRSCRSSPASPPRCASGPSVASTATGCRSPTATTSTPGRPAGDGFPLSMWSNRWSTMPVHGLTFPLLPLPDDRAELDRMPGSTIPVIRQPFEAGDLLPFWVGRPHRRPPPALRPRRRPRRAGEPAGRGARA